MERLWARQPGPEAPSAWADAEVNIDKPVGQMLMDCSQHRASWGRIFPNRGAQNGAPVMTSWRAAPEAQRSDDVVGACPQSARELDIASHWRARCVNVAAASKVNNENLVASHQHVTRRDVAVQKPKLVER